MALTTADAGSSIPARSSDVLGPNESSSAAPANAPIAVPDVSGKSINSASKTLTDLGLKVTYKACTPAAACVLVNWKALLTVSSTSPGADATVHKGDTIHVTTDPKSVHVFDTESGDRLSD